MSDQKKTILVTGGAGFIGSHLVKKYLDEGHRVVVLDNLQTTWKPKHLDAYMGNPRFRFVRGDIIDPKAISGLLETFDWIINCACAGSYTSYQFDPVHTMKTNTVGVINLLDRAKRDGAIFLQTSTSEIYGDPLEVPQREEYRGNVNSLGPRACYDEGKRAAETLCMDYHREYGVDVRIIRIFNTYGPNMDENDGRAITNFVLNALAGKDLVIYGDGSNTRSFQYIDDLILGIDRYMRQKGETGPINLGNPGEVTMKDLAETIKTMTGSSSAIVFAEGATDDPKRRCPDIAKAKRVLGWEPKVPLQDGLTKTIAYFRTLEPAGKKVLVFATTYYPDMGPAEQALFDLSKQMPDTEFHIVTTKFRKGVPEIEEVGTDTVHRVGFGHTLDKYLLPIFGFAKARRLAKDHHYRFVWSVMGSYSGMAALLYKLMNKESNLLVTLDDEEVARKKGMKMLFLAPLYRLTLRKSDNVFVSNVALADGAELLRSVGHVGARGGDIRSFVNQVRYTFADLLNRQEKKLHRPK